MWEEELLVEFLSLLEGWLSKIIRMPESAYVSLSSFAVDKESRFNRLIRSLARVWKRYEPSKKVVVYPWQML